MSEPATVIAGDTISWTKTLADYPAPTWVLSYTLVKDGEKRSITAAASGTDHAVSVDAATSAAWQSGTYTWFAHVTSGSVRKTVQQGEIVVDPDPASEAFDPRTSARVMLDNIEAFLMDPNNLTAASYSIGGRSLSRWSRGELLAERDRLKLEVRGEREASRIAAGLGSPRRIYVRF